MMSGTRAILRVLLMLVVAPGTAPALQDEAYRIELEIDGYLCGY